MDRHKDWLQYAGELLEIANLLDKNEKYNWSCFTYHQSAAAALKAILSKMGESTFGDNLIALFRSVKKEKNPSEDIMKACHKLNGFFKTCRDLESNSEGTPLTNFNADDSMNAKQQAKVILRYAHHESH